MTNQDRAKDVISRSIRDVVLLTPYMLNKLASLMVTFAFEHCNAEVERRLAAERLRDKASAALELLRDAFDDQTEHRYCICGSNDLGRHSQMCIRAMKAQDATQAALDAFKSAVNSHSVRPLETAPPASVSPDTCKLSGERG